MSLLLISFLFSVSQNSKLNLKLYKIYGCLSMPEKVGDTELIDQLSTTHPIAGDVENTDTLR